MKKITAVFAVLALLATASPASAFWGSDDVDVRNKNSAYVKNVVETEADTGDNYAGGSAGGNGGAGGAISGFGNDNNDSQGGAGGNGGAGGLITTGNASATSNVENDVNRNRTSVNSCGCDEEETWFSNGGDVDVRNRNRAKVKNYVETEAETGENTAGGSAGGSGGNAGTIGGFGNDNNENDGGAGGDGDVGGDIYTGNATARTDVVNIVNRNLTRVRH